MPVARCWVIFDSTVSVSTAMRLRHVYSSGRNYAPSGYATDGLRIREATTTRFRVIQRPNRALS